MGQPHQLPPLVVVMGVAGSGKTSVGEALAEHDRLDFADADEFHPQDNIDKMAAGHPLDDEDRAPWLEAIGRWLALHERTGAVATCSALKRRYRDQLRAASPRTVFCHLRGDKGTVEDRVAGRTDHFMPATLVQSQYDTLEPLAPDEVGVEIDLNMTIPDILGTFAAWYAQLPSSPEAPEPWTTPPS
ncbi:MAG: gluconokinase [Nocardioidaceae bacterium]